MKNPYAERLSQTWALRGPSIEDGRVYAGDHWIGREDDALIDLIHRAYACGVADGIGETTKEQRKRMTHPLVDYGPFQDKGGEFYMPTPK